MTTFGEQIKDDYHNDLLEQLQQARLESDDRIRQLRRDIEKAHEQKLRDKDALVESYRRQHSTAREQLTAIKQQADEASDERSQLLHKVDSLRAQVRDLEGRLRIAEDKNGAKTDEINELRHEMERLSKDYNDLMDVKIQLDEELNTYRALLESEESRYDKQKYARVYAA